MIVIGPVQRGDGGVGIGNAVIAFCDQRLGEGWFELRMELERNGWPVGPGKARIRGEIGGDGDFRMRRLNDHLVLVRSRCGYFGGRIHPRLGMALVEVKALVNSSALVEIEATAVVPE